MAKLAGGRAIRTEVRVTLSFTSGEALLMIIAQELVQEINGFVRYIPLVLRRNEPRPRPLSVALGEVSAAR